MGCLCDTRVRMRNWKTCRRKRQKCRFDTARTTVEGRTDVLLSSNDPACFPKALIFDVDRGTFAVELVLHHPILLEPEATIDRLAAGLKKVAAALSRNGR